MNRLISRTLDFIYPSYCNQCQTGLTHGKHICLSCIDELKMIKAPFCEKCGEGFDGEFNGSFMCPNCHELEFDFTFARAAFQSEGFARELIHDFKYAGKTYLADDLARLTLPALEDPRFPPFLENGILVPVPLFWQRQRKRRFNQAELLGKSISRLIGIPIIKAIKRVRSTETQTHFSRNKRLKNLKNAFAAEERHTQKIRNKNIILIDDVFTTGSTTNECAKVLLKMGADEVAVLTTLRG